MKTIVEYTKTNSKKYFKDIKNKECFYSNGVLYMKILQQEFNTLQEANNCKDISKKDELVM